MRGGGSTGASGSFASSSAAGSSGHSATKAATAGLPQISCFDMSMIWNSSDLMMAVKLSRMCWMPATTTFIRASIPPESGGSRL